MFRNSIFFQYVPQRSIMHSIDPRFKIVLSIVFIILVFFAKTAMSMITVCVFMCFLLLFTRIPLKTYVSNLRPILILLIFTTLINFLYGSTKGSILILFRIISISLVNNVLVFSTTATDLTYALQSFMLPLEHLKMPVRDISTIMSISLRFIPTLFEESAKIVEAQRARGAEFESKNIRKKIKAVISVLIPMFVSSFRKANNLAVAMECRCYNSGKGKTRVKIFKASLLDYISVGFVILLIIGVIFCNRIKLTHILNAICS